MRKIVHIINSGKLALDYASFMSHEMTAYHHEFYILNSHDDAPIEASENWKVHYISSKYQLLYEGWHGAEFAEADAIIVSGLFNDALFVSLFPTKIIRKLFLHFWGGDFYDMRAKINLSEVKFDLKRIIKYWLKRIMRYRLYKKSAGLIFLIDYDYEKFKEIVGISREHYVAPMPWDSKSKEKVQAERRVKHQHNEINIVVGNSSTETNHHVEVFELLMKFPLERIKIYVPLSYGDEMYRKEIISMGEDMLGKSFVPMLKLLKPDDYIKFLSTMDIGIYNNDRQQAMGNISYMLGLGNKVFVRNDTSMYKQFVEDGYKVFPVNELDSMNFDEFINYDESDRIKNQSAFDFNLDLRIAKGKWEFVFESIIGNDNEK